MSEVTRETLPNELGEAAGILDPRRMLGECLQDRGAVSDAHALAEEVAEDPENTRPWSDRG